MASLRESVRTWLGIPAYVPNQISGTVELDSSTVDHMRRAMGGQLQPTPQSKTRWYMADLETAEHQADGGRLTLAAQLMRSARRDGTLSGVMATRTDGLVRLPKRFRGDSEIIKELQFGGNPQEGVSAISTFDEMLPPTELGVFAADAEYLGVAVGELVPVENRPYPLFVRHDPEYIVFNWAENQWYFRSIGGLLPIHPGNGRWVLHFRGARQAPWQQGCWKAVGQAFIRKSHAQLNKDEWSMKLAHPARVAVSPQAASEKQSQEWFRAVMAWGLNTVFGMKPGYDVKLLESNGRGWEGFDKTVEMCDQEFQIAVAGQVVTTTGGTGFSNANIFAAIKSDLIQATADALAHTINTQILPHYVEEIWGPGKSVVMSWDTTPPSDKAKEGQTLVQVSAGIEGITKALAPHKMQPDVAAICIEFGIPIKGDINGDGEPDVKQEATDDTTAERPALRLVENDEPDQESA